ncbi:MAG: hypothetical protein KAW14_03130, partial [Candidatus Aegiribacteria sp.]|nr:hypothetical protein [Candidatus Aegiribacteria sp.]
NRRKLTLEEEILEFLSLKDTTCLRVPLATYVANQLDSDPVWLFLVGSPSVGKTEILNLLIDLENVFEVSTFTQGALLSGSPKKETDKNSSGGLLRIIGDHGFIICKDFTSILEMHREQRSNAVSSLREIYDGSYTRWFGSDGGKHAQWKGKLGFIAAVTPVIDAHHSVMNTMGERFIMYRMHTDRDTRLLQTRKALRRIGNSAEQRKKFRRKATELINSIEIPDQFPIFSEARLENFVILSNLVALCRSTVIKGEDRRVELVPEQESPPRLGKQLLTLFCALQFIGCTVLEAWKAILDVAFSSMPELRWKILKALQEDSSHSVKSLVSKIQQSDSSVRRKLEEMESFEIVERSKNGRKDIWCITETVRKDFDILFKRFESVNGSQSDSNFSEMSVGSDLHNTDMQLTFWKSKILDSGKALIEDEIEETKSS